MTGLVPAQRCFDRPETPAEQLEAARRRGCNVVAGEVEPGKAANASVVGTISVAGAGTLPTSRSRGPRAGDGLGAAAELPAVWPVRDFASGFAMPARAAE